MDEKRRGIRVGIKLKTKIKAEKYSFEDEVDSVNISGGGIMIPITKKLPIETQVDLEIFLPDEKPPIKTKGKIAWIKSVSEKEEDARPIDKLCSGIEFIEFTKINDDDEARLLNFIHLKLHKSEERK